MPQFRLFFFLALDYRHEFGCRLHRGKQSQDSVVQITMMAVSTAYRHYGDLLVEFSPSRRESVSYRLEAWRGICLSMFPRNKFIVKLHSIRQIGISDI